MMRTGDKSYSQVLQHASEGRSSSSATTMGFPLPDMFNLVVQHMGSSDYQLVTSPPYKSEELLMLAILVRYACISANAEVVLR